MKRKLWETYWWKGPDKQVEEYIKTCGSCQSSDKSTAKPKVLTTPIPIPTRPGIHYGLDITGPFYNDYSIVVLIDYYSRFPKILITKNTTSQVIILWPQKLFARYGLPDMNITDNGPQFVSHQFETFLAQRDILHIKTAIYTPQENGLVEAFNKSLKYTVQARQRENLSEKEPWISSCTSDPHHLLRMENPQPRNSLDTPYAYVFSRDGKTTLNNPCFQRSLPNLNDQKWDSQEELLEGGQAEKQDSRNLLEFSENTPPPPN